MIKKRNKAFPGGTEPRYLLRDRDGIYGEAFSERVKALGIEEILTAPRSPWQNPFAERTIGTLRRDCLDHVVVLGEFHLRIILKRYLSCYHRARTHLALEKDAPEPRPVQTPEHGHVIEIPEVGSVCRLYCFARSVFVSRTLILEKLSCRFSRCRTSAALSPPSQRARCPGGRRRRYGSSLPACGTSPAGS